MDQLLECLYSFQLVAGVVLLKFFPTHAFYELINCSRPQSISDDNGPIQREHLIRQTNTQITTVAA
jgi:hypothetical protein